MMNYSITNEMTNAKIKTAAKADITKLLIEFFAEKCGEENVGMIRCGGASKSNEIGIRIGSVSSPQETNDLIITLNPTVKEFENRKTAKKTYIPFDFNAARNEYDEYIAEKATATKKEPTKKTSTKETNTNDSEGDDSVFDF